MVFAFAFGAGNCPVLGSFVQFNGVGKNNRFHHLAHGAVCKKHTGHAVFVGKFKTFKGHICHFLNRSRSKNDYMEVAVTGSACCKKIVGLRRLNAAKAGAAALYVNDKSGKIGTRKVRNTFAFKGNTRAGRRSHGTFAGGGNAIYHIYCGNFAFCLKKNTADFGHFFGHIGSNFCLGCNGISEVVTASGKNGRFGKGFVALHKNFFLHNSASFLFFNSDYAIRAHSGTKSASDAFFGFGDLYGRMTFLIKSVP